MKPLKGVFGLLMCWCLFACQQQSSPEHTTSSLWLCEMQLNDSTLLPVQMELHLGNEKDTAWYINGKERIASLPSHRSGDTLFLEHSVFHTSVVIWPDENGWKGYFEDHQRQPLYRIPLKLSPYNGQRMPISHTDNYASGMWNVLFFGDESTPYPATGVFSQADGALHGSFLTETGDYRFLSGAQSGNRLLLSGFDGLHAFFVDARIEEDSIKGAFWSGSHFYRKFEGVRTDQSFLSNPYQLTEIKKEVEPLAGFVYQTPKDSLLFEHMIERGPAVIQIMGTWCPNCMDESIYLNNIFEKYGPRGLKIIGVAFEKGQDRHEMFEKVNKMKKALKMNYPILLGGAPKKEVVLAHFPLLTDLKSYPTTIYFNRSMEPVKIYTGFSGPGTGTFFEEYAKENERLIEELLSQP